MAEVPGRPLQKRKSDRQTAQTIDRKDWRRRIEELWKLAEMYKGD
jgi:hypothetical protein